MRFNHILTGLFILASASSWEARAQEITFLTPKLIDLGKVAEGTVLQDTVLFRNSGRVPIHIASVSSSCGCAVAEVEQTALAPGDTAVIPFALNTRAFRGVVRKNLSISFVKNQLPPERIQIQVEVFQEVEITPRYIYLQRLKCDPQISLKQTLQLSNRSDDSLTVHRVLLNSKLVRVEPEKAVILPGQSQAITVTLKPSEPGRHHINIKIQTSSAKKPVINIPMYVEILP
jgi:hypothetical protein